MGNPAGVRRDFDALEKRRFQAIRLLDDGLNQTDVAHRLSVSRSTVVRWVGQYRHEGREALRKAGRAGRKPRLDAVQSKRLEERLRQGPERLGYETPLWTCPRVADLIEREFGTEARDHVREMTAIRLKRKLLEQ
jgi:transposase